MSVCVEDLQYSPHLSVFWLSRGIGIGAISSIFEEVDRMFFKQLFNSHSKTGIECYYNESASIPIRIKVSARRLMYWWHILSVDKSELIHRVYTAQKLSPVYGDWVKQLDIDKKQFNITCQTQK